MKESELEQQGNARIRDALGAQTFKFQSTVTGMPDRMVLVPGGDVWFIEYKAARGRLSKRQHHVFSQMQEAGFSIFVLRSMDDVERFIHHVKDSL